MTYRIAVIPGDGIGKEVMSEAIKLLDAINKNESINIGYDEFGWNSEYYLQHNRMMPRDGLKTLEEYDAILFGAIGDKRVPDYISIWELIMPIRKSFQQYVNFRPVKILKGIESPLKNDANINFVIIRENSEGEYSNAGGEMFQGEQRELAVQNTIMTGQGIRQVADFAFQLCTKT